MLVTMTYNVPLVAAGKGLDWIRNEALILGLDEIGLDWIRNEALILASLRQNVNVYFCLNLSVFSSISRFYQN